MQSLSAAIRLVQRQRIIDSSRIAHFRSIGAYPSGGDAGFSSSSDHLASARIFGDPMEFGSLKGTLFKSSYHSSAPFAKTGSQTEKWTRSNSAVLFKSAQPGLFWHSEVSAPFLNRLLTTVRNTDGSTTQDSTVSEPELPPRIKFKRLDKTAKHIMQILDKEAVEEVKAQKEIPDIRPGYIVQLKVEVPDNKRRVSVLKGIVIARRNCGLNSTIRIRRLVAGVGVESLYPLYSPNIKEIKVLDKKKVRRAKLYYLRDKLNAFKKQ